MIVAAMQAASPPPSIAPPSGLSPTDRLARENARDADAGIRHGFAPVNGVNLHYAACGDPRRPLLLFLHGFPEFWFAWQPLLRAFGDEWFAVAPDQRGYNLSDKPAALEAYRPRQLMDDVLGLIDHFGHRRATLVAHDWGGAVAWNVAARHGDRLDALVAINAAHSVTFARDLAGHAGQRQASQYMLSYRQPGFESALAADGCAALLDKLRRHSTDARWLDADTRARYLEAWTQPGALTGGLNWYRASPLHPPTADEPGAAGITLDPAKFRVEVPTLVIWGERDPHLLPCLLDGLEALVPDLSVVRDAHGSHWIVHERTAFVIDTMRRWLDGRPRTARGEPA